jgi:hypothetical protein
MIFTHRHLEAFSKRSNSKFQNAQEVQTLRVWCKFKCLTAIPFQAKARKDQFQGNNQVKFQGQAFPHGKENQHLRPNFKSLYNKIKK